MARNPRTHLKLKLPAKSAYGITVRRGKTPPGTHGYWSPDEAEVVIREGQTDMQELVIFFHEALHAAESIMMERGIIKRRAGEKFVTHAAPVLAFLATECIKSKS